jgi:DNA polymerase III sliding clamp (beta) subunit (PCNA family)
VKLPIRFTEALKRIALLSVDKSNAVKISLTSNQLRISSQNPDLGEARTTSRSSTTVVTSPSANAVT